MCVTLEWLDSGITIHDPQSLGSVEALENSSNPFIFFLSLHIRSVRLSFCYTLAFIPSITKLQLVTTDAGRGCCSIYVYARTVSEIDAIHRDRRHDPPSCS